MCILGGVAVCLVFGITAAGSRSSGFPTIVGVGIGVFFLGMIVIVAGRCIVQACFSSRLRKAIITESAKYTSRSPTPCSWRLHTSRFRTGHRNRHITTVYKVSGTILRKGS